MFLFSVTTKECKQCGWWWAGILNFWPGYLERYCNVALPSEELVLPDKDAKTRVNIDFFPLNTTWTTSTADVKHKKPINVMNSEGDFTSTKLHEPHKGIVYWVFQIAFDRHSAPDVLAIGETLLLLKCT